MGTPSIIACRAQHEISRFIDIMEYDFGFLDMNASAKPPNISILFTVSGDKAVNAWL